MNIKKPTEERIVSEDLFDEEFIAYVEWKDKLAEKDAMFIMATYRGELFKENYAALRSCITTSTGEAYIPVRIYDQRRLEYVKDKIIKRFGSIDAGFKAEAQVKRFMNAFEMDL